MEKYVEISIAVLAILLSIYSLWHQRAHDKLTYKPIPMIIKYNYNDRIMIKLWNKGAGPLFITSLKIENKDSLIALMPAETRKFRYVEFIDNLAGRIITPGDSLNLLEFRVRDDDNINPPEKYQEVLNTIKATLNNKVIKLTYANIYNNEMDYTSQKLNFHNLIDETKSVDEIKVILDEKENKS